jgi:hypothetical protein
MRSGELLSLTVILPNEQHIKVPEAVVRWSRGQELGIDTVVASRHTQARLEHYIQRMIKGGAQTPTI